MQVRTKLFLLLISLGIHACDNYDAKLTIVNNTSDTIFYRISFDNANFIYPIFIENGRINFQRTSYVLPDSINREPSLTKWESLINKEGKDSCITIFFFNKDLINYAGKDSIMKYKLFSQRFKFNIGDLEKLNWRVVYQEN